MARILIVDDDPNNRMILKARLERAGHEVAEAADGRAGLEAGMSSVPDLIFLDGMMPRLDGWQVCRALKADARTAGVPVVILTACTRQIDELRGYESGADEFLPKPVEAASLAAALARLLPAVAGGLR